MTKEPDIQNPRYAGATPGDLVRALMRRPDKSEERPAGDRTDPPDNGGHEAEPRPA